MRYTIIGQTVPAVECELNQGESMYNSQAV